MEDENPDAYDEESGEGTDQEVVGKDIPFGEVVGKEICLDKPVGKQIPEKEVVGQDIPENCLGTSGAKPEAPPAQRVAPLASDAAVPVPPATPAEPSVVGDLSDVEQLLGLFDQTC